MVLSAQSSHFCGVRLSPNLLERESLICVTNKVIFFSDICVIEIDLSTGRPGEQSIHRVFVDPGGSHCIATVVGSGGVDTFYTHAKWIKPRVLTKLKGLVVNAVAWNRLLITEGNVFIHALFVWFIHVDIAKHIYMQFDFVVLKHSFDKGSYSWYG